jgi:hypothetical protein
VPASEITLAQPLELPQLRVPAPAQKLSAPTLAPAAPLTPIFATRSASAPAGGGAGGAGGGAISGTISSMGAGTASTRVLALTLTPTFVPLAPTSAATPASLSTRPMPLIQLLSPFATAVLAPFSTADSETFCLLCVCTSGSKTLVEIEAGVGVPVSHASRPAAPFAPAPASVPETALS